MNIILRLVKTHINSRGSSFSLDRFQSLFQTSLSHHVERSIGNKQVSLEQSIKEEVKVPVSSLREIMKNFAQTFVSVYP